MDRRWVVLVVALAAACARFPLAPAEGGPVWTELTSEHFTVWTDADPSRVWELTRTMERFRHLVAGVVYPTTPSTGRALAIVVGNDQELSAITSTGEPRATSSDAMPPLWQPIVLLSLTGSGVYDVGGCVSSVAIRRWQHGQRVRCAGLLADADVSARLPARTSSSALR